MAKTYYLNAGIFIFRLIILSGNGNVFEKWRFLRFAPHLSSKNLRSDILGDVEAVSLVVGYFLATLAHQHDDVLIP